MNSKRKLVIWFMLLPAAYWIGDKLDYSVWALMAGCGYLIVAAYVLFWDEMNKPSFANSSQEPIKEENKHVP